MDKIYKDLHQGSRERFGNIGMLWNSILGEKLKSWEQVHHINKNGKDNRIENLMIMKPKEHTIYTIMEKKIAKLEKQLKIYKEKYGDN